MRGGASSAAIEAGLTQPRATGRKIAKVARFPLVYLNVADRTLPFLLNPSCRPGPAARALSAGPSFSRRSVARRDGALARR